MCFLRQSAYKSPPHASAASMAFSFFFLIIILQKLLGNHP